MKSLQIWYVSLILFYQSQILNDWLVSLTALLSLLFLARSLSFSNLIIINQFILFLDVLLKTPLLGFNTKQYFLDHRCVTDLFSLTLNNGVLVYVLVHIFNMYCVSQLITRSAQSEDKKSWGPFMTQIMFYFSPFCLYTLGLMSVQYW